MKLTNVKNPKFNVPWFWNTFSNEDFSFHGFVQKTWIYKNLKQFTISFQSKNIELQQQTWRSWPDSMDGGWPRSRMVAIKALLQLQVGSQRTNKGENQVIVFSVCLHIYHWQHSFLIHWPQQQISPPCTLKTLVISLKEWCPVFYLLLSCFALSF